MKEPQLVSATREELDEILALAKTSFPRKHYELLEGVLGTFVFVMLKLQNAKTSIKRFQRMLFGARTEHKRNVLELGENVTREPPVDAATAGAATTTATFNDDGDDRAKPPRKPMPGHGRNAAQAYSGAPIVECEHAELESGDRCPQCNKGRVYDSPPRTLVKVVGQAPL